MLSKLNTSDLNLVFTVEGDWRQTEDSIARPMLFLMNQNHNIIYNNWLTLLNSISDNIFWYISTFLSIPSLVTLLPSSLAFLTCMVRW